MNLLLFIILFILIIMYTAKYGSNDVVTYNPHYSRTLSIDDSPRKKYESTIRPIDTHITVKNGQLKLLLTEIEFYTFLETRGVRHVIYIGSAPGSHSLYISKMFPNFQFVFYDPNNFDTRLNECSNIIIINGFFDDKTVLPSHITPPYAFVSDVRSGTEEQYVAIDMENQARWLRQLNPSYAMLKFRLPWSSGMTNYFDGEIRPEPYVGSSSTETRLWISANNNSYAMRDYDNDHYADMLFYFNWHNRIAYHDHNFVAAGFDHCYDCWSYHRIITDYLKIFKPLTITHNDIYKKCDLAFEGDNYTLTRFIDYYYWFGYRLGIGSHGTLPEIKDTNKRITMLHEISVVARRELCEKQKKHIETINKINLDNNQYINDIEHARAHVKNSKKRSEMRLDHYLHEISTITKHTESGVTNTYVIITDFFNDIYGTLKNIDARFIVYYIHKAIAIDAPHIMQINLKPTVTNYELLKIAHVNALFNFTGASVDFIIADHYYK